MMIILVTETTLIDMSVVLSDDNSDFCGTSNHIAGNLKVVELSS